MVRRGDRFRIGCRCSVVEVGLASAGRIGDDRRSGHFGCAVSATRCSCANHPDEQYQQDEEDDESGASADDVGEVGLRFALQTRVRADTLTVRLSSDFLFLADAVVLAEVVALVHTLEVLGFRRNRSESGFAFAAVRVVGGLEQTEAVDRANGLILFIVARIGAVGFAGGSGDLGRCIRRARRAARLLSARLIRSRWTDDANVVLGQERSWLTFGLHTFVCCG